MQEQTTTRKPLQQLKARVQHLRDDASNALHAARHDYEEVLHAVRELRARSEVKAFVKSHFGNGHTEASNGAKPAHTPAEH